MPIPGKTFCPTELEKSLRLVYERFSPTDNHDLRQKLGWDLYGNFTAVFLPFLDCCRRKGHKRLNRRQLYLIFLDEHWKFDPRLFAKRVLSLIQKEREIYWQELSARYSTHPDFAVLAQAFMNQEWEQVTHWFVQAREHKALAQFTDRVPAYELGFWK